MQWENIQDKESSKEVIEKTSEKTSGEITFKSLMEAEKKRGLKIGIYGDFATGKTHFALTAPQPVYIIDTELGAPPLASIFKDKDIKMLDVAEKDGSESFIKITNAIDFITQQPSIKTVIIDSVSDLWDFAQEYAKVNIFKIKPEQRLAQQWDWGVINKLYLSTLLKLIRMNCNVILTARESEVYLRANEPSGIYKPKWQKNTGFWVDYVLYNTKKTDKTGNTTFSSYIEKSRGVGNMMGNTYHNLDYDKFVSEVKKFREEIK